MAKVQSEIVSGVGKNAKRRDLGNVAKIQRSARIDKAAGGPRGERLALGSLTQEGGLPTTGSAVSKQVQEPSIDKTQVTNVFAQGSSLPLTDGAGGPTAGRGQDVLNLGITSPDEGRALAVALFSLYPNQYTRALVEAYDQEGIY